MNMMLRNIPFSPPDMTEEEAKAAGEAILSGWITTGPRTKKLEKKISYYVGTEKTVCLNSQTACGEMVLRLLGIGAGDEVIVPAYSYTASASVICHVGAKPVMIDSQPNSFEMDYDAMEAAINDKTKAIIPVDIFGIPCDYHRIFQAVNNKRNLFNPSNEIQKALGRVAVCADGAHAFGAIYKSRMVGGVADFTSFSFHAVKNFTTAEGGAMTWNLPFGKEEARIDSDSPVPVISGETWNENIYRTAQLYSLHGQNKDALAKTQLGAWEYDVIGPWYKCNMTDIMAAIGLVQFKRYPELLARRREIIERYDAAFKPLGVEVLKHYTADHLGSGHLYICRIPGATPEKRQEIIVKMAQRGISCNVHYKPMPMMTAYRKLGYDIKDFPNAYAHFANEITLPLHTRLSDEDVEYIIDNFKEIVSGVRKHIFLNLAHMSEEGYEQQYVKEAFDSNWVTSMGPNVNAFEAKLSGFANDVRGSDEVLDRNVVCLSAGTAAVHLALIGCGVGPGDEVLVQNFTFCASSHPITYLGARPVFVGSEKDTWNMDPELLEKAIIDRKERTGRYPKAVIPVALYGMPYQIDRIMAVADKYGIPVIEDAAEGLGSRFGGQVLGTFGKYGVLSFNGNKMITTSGGGALICQSKEEAKRIMWYATQARDAYPYYQHSAIGFNYRMSNICAGIGRGQMTVLDEHIEHHKHIQSLYEALLTDVSGITVHRQPSDPRFDGNFWLCAATVDSDIRIRGQENAYREIMRTAIGGAAGVIQAVDGPTTDCQPNENVEALRVFLLDKGIECRPVWKPMHRQPVYDGCAVYTNGVEEDIFLRGLCLPSGPNVTDQDVNYIVGCIKEAIVR